MYVLNPFSISTYKRTLIQMYSIPRNCKINCTVLYAGGSLTLPRISLAVEWFVFVFKPMTRVSFPKLPKNTHKIIHPPKVPIYVILHPHL